MSLRTILGSARLKAGKFRCSYSSRTVWCSAAKSLCDRRVRPPFRYPCDYVSPRIVNFLSAGIASSTVSVGQPIAIRKSEPAMVPLTCSSRLRPENKKQPTKSVARPRLMAARILIILKESALTARGICKPDKCADLRGIYSQNFYPTTTEPGS